jgi:hypothetical protein
MLKQVIIILAILLLLKHSNSQMIPLYDVTVNDTSAASGYFFLHAITTAPNPASFNSMILDKYGRLIYFKSFAGQRNDFKLQPNGEVTHAYPEGGPVNARYLVLDSMFNPIDTVKIPGAIFTDLHDLKRMPNGNYLLLGYENRIMDLSSYNWFSGNGSPGSPNATVVSNVVAELDENNNIVFLWKAADHFQFSDVTETWLSNPNLVDWTHCNAVEVGGDGNIFLSTRHFNEITKINRQTGEIMWRLGGKRNQFTFLNDPYSGFWGQHDIRQITNGNITLFDNGFALNPIHPARGVEYSLNENNMTALLVWSMQYGNNIFSRFTGGVQRVENGNTVIDWGKLSGGNAAFTLVKPDGSNILQVSSADSMTSYRAYNYLSLPFTLQRPVITCSNNMGGYYLEAPAGYSSYLWQNGDTSRMVHVTAPDTFYVFVPYGQGGYISSERIVITSLIEVCRQISGTGHNNSAVPQKYQLYQNYPNPFNPSTSIRFDIPQSGSNENVTLQIYDAAGREVETLKSGIMNAGSFEFIWNAGSFASGVYFYKLSTNKYSKVKKMVLLK